MRKFSARWWVTPELLQWRYMQACREFAGPFFLFPDHPLFREADARIRTRTMGGAEWSWSDIVAVMQYRMGNTPQRMCEELDRMYNETMYGKGNEA